jgi:uncharacterized membrane protein
MTSDHHRRLLERLAFFSDAVFAIAMTLLVIDVKLPRVHHLSDGALAQALVDLLPTYVGFLSSFLVIARFWAAHHELFGMLDRSDGRLLWSNLFLLLTIAFLPFPTAVLSEYVQLRVGMCFYAGWLTLIGVVQVVVTYVALGTRGLVRRDVTDQQRRARRIGSFIPVAIGATAFVAGLYQPLLGIVALAIGSPVYSALIHRYAARPLRKQATGQR